MAVAKKEKLEEKPLTDANKKGREKIQNLLRTYGPLDKRIDELEKSRKQMVAQIHKIARSSGFTAKRAAVTQIGPFKATTITLTAGKDTYKIEDFFVARCVDEKGLKNHFRLEHVGLKWLRSKKVTLSRVSEKVKDGKHPKMAKALESALRKGFVKLRREEKVISSKKKVAKN